MKRRLRGALAFCLCLTAAFSQVRAQAIPCQVYFVTIGSGWYATSCDKNVHGFGEIDGANKSAGIVADGLISGGAVYGVELNADDGNYVTMADIDRALKAVEAKIASQRPAKPLLFFYIVSHGMSAGRRRTWSTSGQRIPCPRFA